MHKVDLLVDPAIENAVQMRRSAETARKARIFNTRHRVLGHDIDALNQQVEEKKCQQYMEKQRDKAFDKLREYHDDLLVHQDINNREKQAALHTGLTQYWATHQRAEDTRDADLQCGRKGAFSITIPESELGPASMQIFQGEDIGEEQRRREQQKNTEKDLRAQKEDDKKRLLRDKQIEMLESKELVRLDCQGLQLRALEEDRKKAARLALHNYNQALAVEQTETQKEQRRREERDNLAEKHHTLTSNMMTECAEADVDRWKGMSPEQVRIIHKEREEQRLEKQRQREAEKIQDAALQLQLLKLSKKAEDEDRKIEELRREKRFQADCYNMQLAREQQAYQEYLNKKLYTNKPSKDYFSQFNTSSR